MYKTLHKKQGSVTVQLRFARSSVTFCAKRDNIELHYAESLSLNVLAEEVHMNPYYFSSFFKKSTGKNFKDYVNQIRLKHAVTLLLDTDKKVYEIAMNVGFGDARAFNDAFQRAYGETPAGYRKRLRK